MKKRFAIVLVILALSLGLAVPAGAALYKKTIEVYSGVDIYVNGVEMEPTDVNGDPVETFVYNGTTYVPIRAVSQFFGYDVDWDGENQRVYIGQIPGEKQYLNDVCPPYQTDFYSAPETITMAGRSYTKGIQWTAAGIWGGYALYNLENQYQTLAFDLGHVDGAAMRDGTINIYLDGELSATINATSEMMPTHYEIPLYGALQMKIEVDGYGACYGLANIEIY